MPNRGATLWWTSTVALLSIAACCLAEISGLQIQTTDGGTTDMDSGPLQTGDAGPDAGIDGGHSPDAGGCVSVQTSNLGVMASFATPEFYSSTSADLNGDGLLDLVGCGVTAGVQVFFGLADGGLSSPLVLEQAWSATSVAVGDINGDGLLDVAAVSGARNTGLFMVFVNDGRGGFEFSSFNQPDAGSLIPYFVQIGDVNGDGDGDLIVSGADIAGGSDVGSDVVEVLLNQGSATFANPVRIPGISGANLIGDLNRDGLADIVANTADGTHFAVLLNLGDGGFSSTQYPFPAWGVALLPNPSGAPDLVGDFIYEDGFSGFFVLKNSGSGAFTVGPLVAKQPNPGAPVVADFNGDCILDVALVFGTTCDSPTPGAISVLYGQSDGGFLAPQSLPSANLNPWNGALMGPTNGPRALAVTSPCERTVAIYGDASR